MSEGKDTPGDGMVKPPSGDQDKSEEDKLKDQSQDSLILMGESNEDVVEKRTLSRWHDFESQYALAVEQSAIIERETWGGQLDFLMSCIASAVGLGNIWRFPFICGQNGGGAFLIPYLMVLVIIARPMYMMEMGLGQFVAGGPVKIWEMAPGFRGVGYTATVSSFFLGSFYACIMGWSLLYMFYSLFHVFPWERKTWAPFDLGVVKIDNHTGAFFELGHLGVPAIDPSEFDFTMGKGLDGPPTFAAAIGLLIGWLLVWASMVVGVGGSGKIAYFTAIFPYIVLLVLLIGGATLEGRTRGLEFFFTPVFRKLLDPKAWFEAIAQCFFSLGITFGGVTMFASFNKFHHKLGTDIIIISIMDTFTSMLAGTCFFMLLGHLDFLNEEQVKKGLLSRDKRETVSKLSERSGAGMAFVVFPNVLEAFGSYPGPQIFSFLFFFMLVVLAVGSANGIIGTIVTVLCDEFPKWNRRIVLSTLCLVSFFLGLVYTCRTGANVITIVDRFAVEQVAYMVAIFETIGIAYVYGLKNICNDFEFMLGYHLSWYWIISWAIVPVLLVVIFISYMATWERPWVDKDADVKHPDIAVGCGWALTVGIWLILPATIFGVAWTRKSRFVVKKIKATFCPTRKWGPRDPAIRSAWRRWKRTKNTEFNCSAVILKALHLREDVPPSDIQAYWSEPIDSPYQSNSSYQSNDQRASAAKVVVTGRLVRFSGSSTPIATPLQNLPSAGSSVQNLGSPVMTTPPPEPEAKGGYCAIM